MTYDTTTETTDILTTPNEDEHPIGITTKGNHGTFTTHLEHEQPVTELDELSVRIATNGRLDNTSEGFTTGTIRIELLTSSDITPVEQSLSIESLPQPLQPGTELITTVSLSNPIQPTNIEAILLSINPDIERSQTNNEHTEYTHFSIDITRPEHHGEHFSATIHYPNDNRQTITAPQYSLENLFDKLEILTEAYDPTDPNALENTICDNPDRRIELAQDALAQYDGCLETIYWPRDRELVMFLSIVNTDPLEDLQFICNMTPYHTTLDFTRTHGLHLRAHWHVRPLGINYQDMDDFDRNEYIQKYADKTIATYESIDAVLAKYNEYTTNTDDVVTNNTVSEWPRIPGTDNNVFHISWRIQEQNCDRTDITGNGFGELTDTDIDTALEYARKHPDAYAEYVESRPDIDEELEELENEFTHLDEIDNPDN